MKESRIDETKFKIKVNETLKALKREFGYTYRELERITGLPATVLSRYVNGHMLPDMERARQLSKTLRKLLNLESTSSGFLGERITKVLTPAVDGVPLATMTANILGGVWARIGDS